MSDGESVRNQLGLIPLPLEGGWARELRSIQTEGMKELPTNMGTHEQTRDKNEEIGCLKSSSILYMLEGKQVSRWHMVDVEEYWCYHAGGNIRLHQILPDGSYSMALIGNSMKNPDSVFQFLVGPGTWFAAELEEKDPSNYSLASCVCVPPFRWEKFHVASPSQLSHMFPQHRHIICNIAESYKS